jgi:cellulose synthase/poly-beta-1,6-N-acetylglucosamine synthase-like glycosyltransferase
MTQLTSKMPSPSSSASGLQLCGSSASLGVRQRKSILCSPCHHRSLHYSRKRYRSRPRSPLASAPPTTVPGVSIIRPLKGLDPNIFENLESSFTQEYPLFEILLAVADADDPVLPVARELCAKYPQVNARIIIGKSSDVISCPTRR